MKKICIFGAGASARETYWIAMRCGYEVDAFLDLYDGYFYENVPILSESFFDKKIHFAVIAVGSPKLRHKISSKILDKYGDVFISVIDPSVTLLSPNIKIGIGAVIAPQCVLTCDISIGSYCQINVGTSIMHDFCAGDFFTTAPGVKINGRVKVGDMVYFGTNSSTKEEINITSDVIIGAGACVVKDLEESGTYIGVPAKRLK